MTYLEFTISIDNFLIGEGIDHSNLSRRYCDFTEDNETDFIQFTDLLTNGNDDVITLMNKEGTGSSTGSSTGRFNESDLFIGNQDLIGYNILFIRLNLELIEITYGNPLTYIETHIKWEFWAHDPKAIINNKIYVPKKMGEYNFNTSVKSLYHHSWINIYLVFNSSATTYVVGMNQNYTNGMEGFFDFNETNDMLFFYTSQILTNGINDQLKLGLLIGADLIEEVFYESDLQANAIDYQGYEIAFLRLNLNHLSIFIDETGATVDLVASWEIWVYSPVNSTSSSNVSTSYHPNNVTSNETDQNFTESDQTQISSLETSKSNLDLRETTSTPGISLSTPSFFIIILSFQLIIIIRKAQKRINK